VQKGLTKAAEDFPSLSKFQTGELL
jgi:hypothetical protein